MKSMQFFHSYITKCNCFLQCRMAGTKFYAIVEFEDGLQIIPNNWLSSDLQRAAWPNFPNNNRYDKAVKVMEEPQSTWLEHPIRKIYGTCCKYSLKYYCNYMSIIISHSIYTNIF